MSFKATPEQQRIFKFIQKRPENILIEAYAGAGKTSTIVEAVKLLPKDKNIMFLAFNKHIQEELKARLPEHVRCYTSHGLGMSAIKRKYGDKIQFDEFKADKHINKRVKRWGVDQEFSREDKFIYLNEMKKLINLCRLSLTLDKKWIPYIADRYEINKFKKDRDVSRVLKVLDGMTQDRKTFDYTDMVYLPAVDKGIWLFPQDYVIIDECLPHKTYISTTDGKKQIGTLSNINKKNKELPLVITYNTRLLKFENKKILDVWCTGEKDVHYVMLGGKRKLKSTINHKFLTINGWKRLDELKVGDGVLTNYTEQPYHATLSPYQKDLFIGSSLGDGNLHNLSKNICRLRVVHGKDQYEYAEWKANHFNAKLRIIEQNGFSNKTAFAFNTKGYYFDDDLLKRENAINELTLRSLAISWMDDGTISRKYNSSHLYATANSFDLTKQLSETLDDKWGITSTVKSGKSTTTDNEYWWLLFDKKNTNKLSKLISPYVHKSMEYKICPEHRGNIDNNYWLCSENPYGCIIVTQEHKFLKREKTYDMTVEDNHNFIVTSSTMIKTKAENYGIITHNCQDINRAQQSLIQQMLKKDKVTKKQIGRLIAIGDGFQSIYGFTGITDRTFNWFKEYRNTKVLPLSYSFRCSKKVIEHANKLVPEIKALPDAPEGSVRKGNVLEEARDGDFVLCRTTAPLIQLFFEFLTQRKKAVIKGADIGLQLIDLIGKISTLNDLIVFWEQELVRYRTELSGQGILNPNEHTGYSALEDKANTLLFLARISLDVSDLIDKIKTIFTDQLEGIVLSTIHKAKGLEANRVFIIRPDLIPLPMTKNNWQMVQEKNLEYVAITRARYDLIYDYEWTDEPEE